MRLTLPGLAAPTHRHGLQLSVSRRIDSHVTELFWGGSGNQIGDAGATALAGAMGGLGNLQSLDLG